MDQDILDNLLNAYQLELEGELKNILNYWATKTPDDVYGGFYPQIDNYNNVNTRAVKGSVLNARILWTFSAAYNFKGDEGYLAIAHRAYQYVIDHFIDKQYGGVFWTVDYKGRPFDTKKQVYAIAFTIYGLSEYYAATGITEALNLAVGLYRDLVDKAYDHDRTGYFEAFTVAWHPIADLRLSDKDANEKKTMNTHLHVIESFSNLYKVWPDKGLNQQIVTLLGNFSDHMIDNKTNRLNLFFDENWNRKSNLVSYGHDIEASWLLLECAEIIHDETLIQKFKNISVNLAEAATDGLDADGSLWYEYEPDKQHAVKEKHWWVQAEAMVGFYNAWQLSGNNQYLNASINCWHFVKAHIIDHQNGEWFWGVYADGKIMANEDKVGVWKCPYHNSRACMEIIKRINTHHK
jgi:mannobiose 2-epimerase